MNPRLPDPYSGDILRGHSRRAPVDYPQVAAEPGLVVEVLGDDFVGEILGNERSVDGDFVRLEDRWGSSRLFKLRPGGFLLEGKRVTLTRYVAPQLLPRGRGADGRTGSRVHPHSGRDSGRSNSGSRRVENLRAKVAAPSRIWVEGVHDAAIVEQVWGHDLRVEGVVVEYLEGLDNLPARLEEFGPGPQRRVGVLADHLIEGSKETRLTAGLGPYVMVTGHPFIDVWAAVRPASVGIQAWPEIPRGTDWKTGVCRQLGWGSPQDGWRRVAGAVRTFRDLDPTLIGAVERLIDFVTVGVTAGEE